MSAEELCVRARAASAAAVTVAATLAVGILFGVVTLAAGEARAADGDAKAAAATATPARPGPEPTDATGALDRVRAAYEYGDIDEVVEWSRKVADGRFPPSPPQRVFALRYLGIGLYLTGRSEGAEAAFFELLRLRPDSQLDPRTTRPDVVAFFEQVRQRHRAQIGEPPPRDNHKSFVWNFLPPAGQLQNGHTARAITLGGLEALTLGTAITTRLLLASWEMPDHTFPGHYDDARLAKAVNWTSIGLFAAVVVYGVIDGIAHYGDPTEEAPANPSTAPRVALSPTGIAVAF